ncbi:MAG TPA: magnesium transporter [Planctomycetota bacterium]|jgi:magnesium transporter|nr:magnesium transporter [Planctomycetota bacterium]
MADDEQNLSELLEQEGLDRETLRTVLASIHPVDLAELLDDADLDGRVKVFEVLDSDVAAQVLAAMPHNYKVELVDKIGEEKLGSVIDKMPDNAVADIIDHLPLHKEKRVLSGVEAEKAADIAALRQYPPNSAGGRMTRNFVTVNEDTSAREIIKQIQGAVDPHTVDFIYVTDDQGHLKGISSLARLMLHKPDEKVGSFMRKEISFVGPSTDQEEVARLAQKYRIRAVPVVDADMKMLGVVTLQDIVEVIQQEASEDMHKMAGSVVADSLHTPTFQRYKMRLPWILLTLGGELSIAVIISKVFGNTLEKAAILSAFMPAITAAGGNVGLQCTTLIVRGLGMGTIKFTQLMKILATELKLGMLLGVTCGIAAAGAAAIIEHNHPLSVVLKLGLAVFLAMVSATGATSIVGSLEPLVLHRFKLDPATACGPFVTMFNDIFGTTVYFLIATLLNFTTTAAAIAPGSSGTAGH